MHLEIGNPYGFTLNQCRLLGDYGTVLPTREAVQRKKTIPKKCKPGAHPYSLLNP